MLERAHPQRRERASAPRAAVALFGKLNAGKLSGGSSGIPLILAIGAGALSAGCDQGNQHNQQTQGPEISVTGVNVGAGNPDLPANGSVQIGFDRLLNPLTVTRQAIQLRDGSGQPLTPVVTYDPVARLVTLSDPSTTPGSTPWLTPKQPYKIIIGIPANGDDDVGGIRAIDRATLDPNDPLREIAFLAGAATATPPVAEPKTRFCFDVLPIFQRSCTGSQCHSAPRTSADPMNPGTIEPSAGLVLEDSAGVANTAISRVSNGSNTGALAGPGGPPGRLFGIDMPLIDPGTGGNGDPANSWLLYKVLLSTPIDAANFTAAVSVKCDGTTPGTPPLASFQPAPFATGLMDDIERGILSDYVIGREMPYPPITPTGVGASLGLTFDELERLRLWIAQGAEVDDCGACEK